MFRTRVFDRDGCGGSDAGGDRCSIGGACGGGRQASGAGLGFEAGEHPTEHDGEVSDVAVRRDAYTASHARNSDEWSR